MVTHAVLLGLRNKVRVLLLGCELVSWTCSQCRETHSVKHSSHARDALVFYAFERLIKRRPQISIKAKQKVNSYQYLEIIGCGAHGETHFFL